MEHIEIKSDVKERVWMGVNCIYFLHDRDMRWAMVNTIMEIQLP
jgi:hypothetical protein